MLDIPTNYIFPFASFTRILNRPVYGCFASTRATAELRLPLKGGSRTCKASHGPCGGEAFINGMV